MLLKSKQPKLKESIFFDAVCKALKQLRKNPDRLGFVVVKFNTYY